MASPNALEEDSFLSQLESVRVELRNNVARAHKVLHEREIALLSELLELETRYKGVGVVEQMKELSLLEEQAVTILQRNENKKTLEANVTLLNSRKKEIEANLKYDRHRIWKVELQWDENLDKLLSKTGMILMNNQVELKKKEKPVMEVGIHRRGGSSEACVFNSPFSVAIDHETNNLYVCDCLNQRVQVFDESLKYLFEFNDEMRAPMAICINLNKVYITHFCYACLNVYSKEGRFIQSVACANEELLMCSLYGLAVSTKRNLIYICDEHSIQCWNLNLTFNSYIPNIDRPIDIKLNPQNMIVLTESNPCIQFYDYSHQLIKQMITQGVGAQVSRPWRFCLDEDSNILITDLSANCVLIFSNTGQLIHTIGKKGIVYIFITLINQT